jgi:hypothetical protein
VRGARFSGCKFAVEAKVTLLLSREAVPIPAAMSFVHSVTILLRSALGSCLKGPGVATNAITAGVDLLISDRMERGRGAPFCLLKVWDGSMLMSCDRSVSSAVSNQKLAESISTCNI